MYIYTPSSTPDQKTLQELAANTINFQLQTYLLSDPLPAKVYVSWGENYLLWCSECQRLVKTTSDPVAVAFLEKIGGKQTP